MLLLVESPVPVLPLGSCNVPVFYDYPSVDYTEEDGTSLPLVLVLVG